MKRLSYQPGFTIIELLVAIGVAVLVIGFVNQMFNATSRAVTRGVQFGDVIVNNRSIAERLYEDGQAMVAPKSTAQVLAGNEVEGGMLVIFNRRIDRGGAGVWMPDPATPDDEFFAPSLRSDQLMFIKSTGSQPIETFAPIATNTFAGKGNHAASYAKVWWGHVQRTNPNGIPLATTLDTAAVNDPNYNGWQWILGRQELFLSDATPVPAPAIPAWYVTPAVNVDGVNWDSAVTGTTPAGGIAQQNWSALADVSNRPLFYDPAAAAATSPDPLISTPANSGVFPDNLAMNTYQEQAYNLLFPIERLQVNDSPEAPYDAWRIAQMVPYVAQGVSDFVVEFAADANADGIIDTDGDGDFTNGPETAVSVGQEPRIFWYGIDRPPTYTNFDFGAYTTSPLVSPPPVAGANDPYDANPTATLGVPGSNADAAFVWRHDYPDNWPYLIRVRYRLHDGKGVVRTSEDEGLTNNTLAYTEVETAQSGRWFEIVIPVNREAD